MAMYFEACDRYEYVDMQSRYPLNKTLSNRDRQPDIVPPSFTSHSPIFARSGKPHPALSPPPSSPQLLFLHHLTSPTFLAPSPSSLSNTMSSPHHHHHQPTPPPTIPDALTSADDNNTDETLPLPLSASLVLTSLPQDAHQALEQAAQEAAGGGGKGGIPEKGMETSFAHLLLLCKSSRPFHCILALPISFQVQEIYVA